MQSSLVGRARLNTCWTRETKYLQATALLGNFDLFQEPQSIIKILMFLSLNQHTDV